MTSDFDLQSHSTRSDGALEPAGVVARAAAAGVRLLALTDHDTVDGVPEALAEAERHAVGVVPAVELSTVDALGEDLHVLGYGIDHTDAVFERRLAGWRADRSARVDRMAGLLADRGLEPDRAMLQARAATGLPIGRPHLAAAVVAVHGERLAREGLAEPSAFLVAYLTPGRPAYSGRSEPLVGDAIEAIHDAGGLAVWAHGTSRVLTTSAARSSASGPPGWTAWRRFTSHTIASRRCSSPRSPASSVC